MSAHQAGETARRLPPRPPPPETLETPRDPTRFALPLKDSWRPPNEFTFRNNDDASRFPPQGDSYRNEFTFRNNDDAPRFPPQGDSYRPPPRSRKSRAQQRNQRSIETNGNLHAAVSNPNPQQKRGAWGRNRGGRGNRVATAERPLLSIKQGDATEQMFGMFGDVNGTQRFLPVNDVSDSEEEQMEESESDKDNGGGVSLIKSGPDIALDSATGDSVERPAKRRAFGPSKSGLESEAIIPRWSNPDPYTSLPPIDDQQRKKKDVVKIIRKARIVAEKQSAPQNQVAANDDFISFGFEDELSTDEGTPSRPASRDSERSRLGVPGVPSGPSRSSRLDYLRDQGIQSPPGVQGISISSQSMGPPPGLDLLAQAAASVAKADLDLAQDSALGIRKRTHDDVIKGAARPTKRERESLKVAQGSLTKSWVPSRDVDSTPWLNEGSSCKSENAGFRLHKEICDFYEFVRPQSYEQKIRETLLQRLQVFVRDRLRCDVYSFGSFAAGLYLPNADMDLVVISNEYRTSGEKVACQSPREMHKFASQLRASHIAQDQSVVVITHAKVPLVKFVDRITSIKVDISFENDTGLFANTTFLTWKSQFPAMPILVTVIKQFLMMRGLNEVVDGGLGGFSVTCLVTSLLQNLPRVQTKEFTPEHHLGEILIEFLDFYGNQLDVSRTGIMMDPPGYFNKLDFAGKIPGRSVYHANRADRLAIMDPNKPDNDISGGSKNIMLIFDCFSQAHEEILDAMNSPDRRSLLRWPLGGDYGTFAKQRKHLRKLFKERWGSPEPGFVEFQDRSNELAPGQSGHNEPATVVSVQHIKKTSKRKPRKSAQHKSVTGTHPPVPIDLNKKVKRNHEQLQIKDKEKAAKQRAAGLKKTYPDIKNVPDRIDKKQFAHLVQAYKNSHISQPKPEQQRLNAGGSRASKGPRTTSLPEVTEARRREVARNLGGLSNSDPIFID